MTDTIALREYIDLLAKQSEKELDLRLDALAKALDLKAKELERRLESLNELRSEVTKDRNLLVRRELYDNQVGGLEEKLQSLDKRVTIIETRAVVWAASITVMFLVIQLILRYWGK